MRRMQSTTLNRMPMSWMIDRIGNAEVPGPGANPVIMEIINRFFPDRTDDSETAWCGMAMSAAMNDTMPWQVLPRIFDPIEGGFDGSTLSRTWRAFGRSVMLRDARHGDVVVWRKDAIEEIDDELRGHVAFFMGFNRNTDGTLRGIMCYGGNQGNAFKPVAYRFNSDGLTPGLRPDLRVYHYGKLMAIRRICG